jgi:SAM-dependent methyltransferase
MSGQSPEPGSYTGTDNLEVMSVAVRYNAYLASLVTSRLDPGRPSLDFGAGIGTFTQMIHDEGFQVDGLDLEPRHQEAIRARGIRAVPSLGAVADATYAGVFTFNVLEHIEDDMAVLSDFRRILEPGGTLIVYVPAIPWLWTSMDTKVGHVRRYYLRELVAKVRRAGFHVEEQRYVDSVGVLATLAYKALPAREGDLDPRSVRAYDRLGFPVSVALDHALHRVVGKNVLVVATRPR